MKIEIDILSDPKDFVEKWSKQYSINNNYLYNENIQMFYVYSFLLFVLNLSAIISLNNASDS